MYNEACLAVQVEVGSLDGGYVSGRDQLVWLKRLAMGLLVTSPVMDSRGSTPQSWVSVDGIPFYLSF